jgi:hypothetical protein
MVLSINNRSSKNLRCIAQQIGASSHLYARHGLLVECADRRPIYVRYYKDEYARFEPQLTPAARVALANLKRKIKDENKTSSRLS